VARFYFRYSYNSGPSEAVLTDTSKAVLNFPTGSVQIEGPQSFVADCVAKFPQQQAADGGSQVLLEQSVGHAWDWFALHANQRMQAVNFFLVAAAFLTAAYVNAIQYAHPVVAIGVAALGVFFCLVFYAFELRIRELIKTGEKALGQAQQKLAAITGLGEFEICKLVEKPRYPITSYHKVIRSLYMLTGITFLIGVGYAVHLSSYPVPVSGIGRELLIIALYRFVLLLGGILSVYWAQRLILSTQASLRWLNYVFAGAFGTIGILVLALSALKPLK
jgi:hypothetical protein